MKEIKIILPIDDKELKSLTSGDIVLLTGTLYTARDAAHKKMSELAAKGRLLPFDVKNAIIYYMGPTPARPRRIIGSAGPTTSSRMDPYTPKLLEMGLKGMIGKGRRSPEVRKAMLKHRAVYFAATGGAGALLSQKVTSCKPVAFEELGPEAILRLEVRDFPVIVINDIHGGDLYDKNTGRKK